MMIGMEMRKRVIWLLNPSYCDIVSTYLSLCVEIPWNVVEVIPILKIQVVQYLPVLIACFVLYYRSSLLMIANLILKPWFFDGCRRTSCSPVTLIVTG